MDFSHFYRVQLQVRHTILSENISKGNCANYEALNACVKVRLCTNADWALHLGNKAPKFSANILFKWQNRASYLPVKVIPNVFKVGEKRHWAEEARQLIPSHRGKAAIFKGTAGREAQRKTPYKGWIKKLNTVRICIQFIQFSLYW